jgi:ABC-2 type transport system ATP-binding protein
MDQSVISTVDLSRRFGEIHAVDNLSIEVYRGEVFGFLGHNGAGKTTTVRLLNGVLLPTSGTINVLNFDPVSQGSQLRRQTGVLTETPSLEERLSGRDNLRIYGDLYGYPPEHLEDRVMEMLEHFQLVDKADERVSGYSKGMRQRLALARAFLHDPELIFLDEPTADLDPVAARDVRQLVKDLTGSGGHTVFLCTHNLGEAQELCTRVAVLENGRLIALGTPAELEQKFGGSEHLVIEVSPDTKPKAIQILQSQLGKVEMTSDHGMIDMTGLHHEAIPGLLRTLVSSGIDIYQVTPQQATLEDVYFALQGDHKEIKP